MSDDTKTKQLIKHIEVEGEIVRAEDFLPLLSVEQAVARKKQINLCIAGIMTEGEDFGKMPGDRRDDAKKVLLKPGAEKLCSVFGLVPNYVKETVIEDWTGEAHGGEALFYYEYRCVLYRGNRAMGEAIGSANSWETKHRYRWVGEETWRYMGVEATLSRGGRQKKFEPDFAISQRASDGKYGKPGEYWDQFTAAAGATRVTDRKLGTRTFNGWEITVDATQYRIPNPETGDLVNTLQKMAQKRALVAAVLVVTNCSDAFTQDLDDFSEQDNQPMTIDHRAGIDTNAGHEREIPGDGRHGEGEELKILPPELEALFGPNAPRKGYKTALESCRRELLEALPQNGSDEYLRILSVNGITPETIATVKVRDIANSCVQMWTLAQSAKRLQSQKPSTNPLPADQSDWPEGRE